MGFPFLAGGLSLFGPILGVALAMQHFNAVVALPASLFSVVHNLTGSTLSSIWRHYKADDK